jgi:tRNA pseudouridine55 synthase
VHCSSGFYIRSLADDLGNALGCGAHVVELRRVAIKDIGLEETITLQDFEASLNQRELIAPIDSLIQHMPIMNITDSQANELKQGRAVQLEQGDEVPLSRLVLGSGKLFALGQVDASGVLKTNKMFVTE